MNNFTDKLNFIPGNIYTVEEEIHVVGGVYEADLIHDNITQDTVAVFTGSRCTGKRINSFAISTPSLAPWKTHIKIFTSESVVYVTYETIGDTVEADDINDIQDAINDTQKALKDETTRATNAEKTLTTNLNAEVTRAKKAENTLQTNINNEVNRAKKAESDELTRATNAENTITTNLNNEVARAKKAEADEATRAKNAEKTLTDNLNSEINRAKTKENDINTALGNRYTKDQTFTKSEVLQKIQDVIGTAPAALDTLQEIAKALNDDSNFAGTVTTELSKKVNKSGDTMTGTLSIKKSGDNATLLTFDTERPWSFKQGDTGASSTLDLVSSSGDKSFRVLNVDKTKGLEVHTSPTNTQVTIDGNKVYHAGDKPKLSELTNDAGFIKASDVDTSQNHIHSNKTVLDKITQNSLDVWNDGVRRIAFIGSDADGTNGWYKVAEQTCNGYGDTNITFMVTSTYSNYNVGILQLQIRSDSSSISCRTLKWLTRMGFNVNHYIVVINGMKWTLYANQPSNRYGRIAFEILSMSSIDKKNISWALTFKDNNVKETTEPVATVKSSDGATVDYAARATKAASDVDGNRIDTTYVKKGMTWAELEGKQ